LSEQSERKGQRAPEAQFGRDGSRAAPRAMIRDLIKNQHDGVIDRHNGRG